MELTQYEIILVNLDPTIGSEMQKTRPAIIISPNELNKYLNTIVIAPMTSSSKAYPTRVEVKHNKTKGWVVLDQIRTIDRQRVTKKLGHLTEKEIEKVKAVLKETFVD
ncbi:MAG: type II toxin-antitoxin system PemK/MazF family toxin [Sphingobacteriales bacterium]|nr:type II toxin-antitoxin system PemK/MazF family toxin [Sphingobacteriales bacterium]